MLFIGGAGIVGSGWVSACGLLVATSIIRSLHPLRSRTLAAVVLLNGFLFLPQLTFFRAPEISRCSTRF